MAKLGDRLAWKDRIDQSAWVDNAEWLDDEAKSDAAASVEFLEAEPSAYRLSETRTAKGPGLFESNSAKLLGFGGLAVVLLAIALMSRPGDQDPFDQLPADKQQEIRQRQSGLDPQAQDGVDQQTQPLGDDVAFGQSRTTLSTPLPQPSPTPDRPTPLRSDTDEADAEGGVAVLPPVPDLRTDLSAEMPDLLYIYGEANSVVQIRRSDDRPLELELPAGDRPGAMTVSRSDELPLVLSPDGLTAVLPDGTLESSPIEAQMLLPADDGIVLVSESTQTREVIISSLLDDDAGRIELGYDVDLLGAWQGRPLIHKAGAVWLLSADGGLESVTEGVPVAYDGLYLTMVRCNRPDDCRIEVGPPDQPSLRSVPVPENFAGRAIESWTTSVSVSRDGSRLAVVDRRGVSLPTWIDLDTGIDTTRSESVNHDSPVVWSPDGRWLAYAFGDDVIAWDTEANQSWRIFVDRPISHLAWTLDLG